MTHSSPEIALLPCPFCGNRPTPPFRNMRDDEDEVVKCWTIQHPCASIDHEIWTYADASAEECARRWNTRATSAQAAGEPVAWRWRPRGAVNWIYDPTAEWRSQQKEANIDIEPLYRAPPQAASGLLQRARQFVAESGCDEDDSDVNAERDRLLADIDAALSRPDRGGGQSMDEAAAENFGLTADDFDGGRVMTRAVGWAVVASGARIFVKTVSDTRRAAIINWLVTEKEQLITIFDDDLSIEKMWKHHGSYVDCRQVTISDDPLALSSHDRQGE